jgi:O-antigen/teichoic acid export membrane protein
VGISLYTCFIPEVFGIESVWIYGAWFAAILNVLTQFALVLLRNQDRVLFFGAMEIGNTALNLSLAFMLIKFFHYSWPALVISLVLANSIFALLAILYMLRNEYLRISLNLKMIKEVLVVSIPLVPHAVSGVIIALSDRLFIRHFNGDSSVAIYSAGYTLCMVILLFTDAFNKVWSPWLFKQLAEVTESRKIKIVQITYFYAIGVGIISLLYIGICQYLVDWILPISYQPAKVYIIWVIPAFAIQGLYFVVFPYLVHLGKTQFLGFMTGIAAITNLFGNYYLIRKNGPVGAAQSTLVSYIALVVIVWCYVCRAYPMPWLSPMRKVKTSIILSFRRYI